MSAHSRSPVAVRGCELRATQPALLLRAGLVGGKVQLPAQQNSRMDLQFSWAPVCMIMQLNCLRPCAVCSFRSLHAPTGAACRLLCVALTCFVKAVEGCWRLAAHHTNDGCEEHHLDHGLHTPTQDAATETGAGQHSASSNPFPCACSCSALLLRKNASAGSTHSEHAPVAS